MRNVAVVTGGRADYGALHNVLKKIKEHPELCLQLIVTGSHLLNQYGMTVDEIIGDGFEISDKIEVFINPVNGFEIGSALGKEIIGFCESFERLRPDILLIIGDRYEIFAAASAAMCMHIPIAHISGGESTEGCIDEQIRHAITKMAHLHFTANEEYKNRVKKMGEEAWRVYNVGDVGVENINNLEVLSKLDLEKQLEIKISEDAFLITYHPVTNEIDEIEFQIEEFLKALDVFKCQQIFTYPNADEGGRVIIDLINEYIKTHENARSYDSLGRLRFLNLMKHVKLMIGNSSSGIIEAPSFKLPVINIGNRQKGRIKSDNIVDCGILHNEIIQAVNYVQGACDFREKLKNSKNLYESGNTSDTIVDIIANINIDKKLLNKKLEWE